MIIDMEDGWSFNTEFFLGARPHPDKKGMTRVIMTRDEASFITTTKSWEMLMSRLVDIRLTEIKAEITQANKQDGELVMHESKPKRKNEEGE